MPRRSSVLALPAAMRAELDARIIESGFADYAKHAAWCAERGHPCSESVLQRYGQRMKRGHDEEAARLRGATAEKLARVRATMEVAREVRRLQAGDVLAVPEQAAHMLMARVFELSMQEGMGAKDIQALARTLREMFAAVGGPPRRGGRRGGGAGVPAETLATIRRDVYGIHDDDRKAGMSAEVMALIDGVLMPAGKGSLNEGDGA